MQIKLTFDPSVDQFDSVLAAVVGAFGMTDSAVMSPNHDSVGVHAASAPHDNVAAAQNFANGVNSNGQQFQPSPEAATTTLAIAQQQNQQQAAPDVAQQAGEAVSVELDKDGLPWDARIHADGKDRKTRAGYWKKKRGVHDALVKQVTEELRAKLAAASSVNVEGAVNIPAGGVLGGIQTDNGSAPPAANTPATPPTPTADPASSFAALMAYAMQHMQNPGNPTGPLTAAHLTDVAKQLQLIDPNTGNPEIRLLDQRVDLLPLAKQWVDHYIANPQLLGPQPSGLPGQ